MEEEGRDNEIASVRRRTLHQNIPLASSLRLNKLSSLSFVVAKRHTIILEFHHPSFVTPTTFCEARCFAPTPRFQRSFPPSDGTKRWTERHWEEKDEREKERKNNRERERKKASELITQLPSRLAHSKPLTSSDERATRPSSYPKAFFRCLSLGSAGTSTSPSTVLMPAVFLYRSENSTSF